MTKSVLILVFLASNAFAAEAVYEGWGLTPGVPGRAPRPENSLLPIPIAPASA